MSDPPRLLSNDSDADELERALIDSLRGAGPDARQKAAMLGALAAQLGVGGAVVASSSAAKASALGAQGSASAVTTSVASQALGLKVVALVAALGAAAVGGRLLWTSQPVVKPPIALTHVAAPVEEPAVDPAPVEASPPKVNHPAVRTHTPAPKPQPERLALETRLLTEARAALRSGDSATARHRLARLRSEFPSGVLGQEREVLTIEVLAAEGQRAAAAEHLRAFATSYPESPHVARLEKLVAAP
jgi:hypothetical protein